MAVLKSCDRFTRDYVTMQDAAKAEPDVENVDSSYKLNAAAGETPMKHMPQMLLKQPEVICVPEICRWRHAEARSSSNALRSSATAS